MCFIGTYPETNLMERHHKIFVGHKTTLKLISRKCPSSRKRSAWPPENPKAVRRSHSEQTGGMRGRSALKSGKSASGWLRYRQARTLKMTVEAVTNLFDLMPNLAPEAKQTAAASIINQSSASMPSRYRLLRSITTRQERLQEQLGVTANKIGRIANMAQPQDGAVWQILHRQVRSLQ